MTIRARATAIWATAQWLIILSAIAALSIALNLWQWKRAITAPLRAEVAAQTQAAKDSQALNEAAAARERSLMAAADIVTGQLTQADKDYRSAVKNRPLGAQCAPGAERMDAMNKAMGQSRADNREARP